MVSKSVIVFLAGAAIVSLFSLFHLKELTQRIGADPTATSQTIRWDIDMPRTKRTTHSMGSIAYDYQPYSRNELKSIFIGIVERGKIRVLDCIFLPSF